MSAEASFGAGPLAGAAAAAALAALLPPAQTLLPRLEALTHRRVLWGVRALPPRTPAGALPLAGRLRLPGGAAAAAASAGAAPAAAAPPDVWLLGGLGARGLVYHAWLAERLARAVLDRDDGALPPELAPPLLA